MPATPPTDHAVWRPTDPRPVWATRPAWWWTRLRHGRAWRPVFLVALTALVTTRVGSGPGDVPDTVEVVTASATIEAGATVQPDDLVLRDVPESMVPEGALVEAGLVVGRVAAVPLPAGRPITELDLGDAGTVRAGERAIAVAPIEPVIGLAAGDRVDLVGVRFDVFGLLERRRLVTAARVIDPGDDRHPPLVAVPDDLDLDVLDWAASGTVAFSRHP